ncbi:MAG: hypothetical protein VKJ02_05395 [Snowella sp.]|nr:hypothetical protein [Snowella sp.]
MTVMLLGIPIPIALGVTANYSKSDEALIRQNTNLMIAKVQVVESGPYLLKFIAENEKSGIHLDVFLQRKDNKQTITNAQVTGQIQLPNGQQKNLTFTYDAKGKHYMTLIKEKAAGQYQVRVTANINGQKVNARFSFKR